MKVCMNRCMIFSPRCMNRCMNSAWIFSPRWPYSKRLKTVENSRRKKGKKSIHYSCTLSCTWGQKIHVPIHAPGEKIVHLFMHLFTHLFIHLFMHRFNRQSLFLFIHRVCGACQIERLLLFRVRCRQGVIGFS